MNPHLPLEGLLLVCRYLLLVFVHKLRTMRKMRSRRLPRLKTKESKPHLRPCHHLVDLPQVYCFHVLIYRTVRMSGYRRSSRPTMKRPTRMSHRVIPGQFLRHRPRSLKHRQSISRLSIQ